MNGQTQKHLISMEIMFMMTIKRYHGWTEKRMKQLQETDKTVNLLMRFDVHYQDSLIYYVSPQYFLPTSFYSLSKYLVYFVVFGDSDMYNLAQTVTVIG